MLPAEVVVAPRVVSRPLNTEVSAVLTGEAITPWVLCTPDPSAASRVLSPDRTAEWICA